MAGQRLGLKEVDDGIWVVSFMDYDLGYIDLEQKTLQPIDNPFGARVSPMSQVRSVTYVSGPDTGGDWRAIQDETANTQSLKQLFDLPHATRSPDLDSQQSYLKWAEEMFRRDDKVAVFIFGHTYGAFLKRVGSAGQVILNTGTWQSYCIVSGYPSYRYFRIEAENEKLVIRSVHIPKTPEGELTWPQRLLTLGKAPYLADPIPDETIIDM